MKNYGLTIMPEESLRMLRDSATNLLALFSAHYQAIVFNTGADIYYVGCMVERLRDILAETNEEISKRKPVVNVSPLSDFSF